jgi:hypothetical protein
MERTVAKYSNHGEAEQATLEYYRSLTPAQRLDILFELIEASRKEGDRFRKICKSLSNR